MPDKIRLIVNAVPATRIQTGIARYLRCLYGELEKSFSQEMEIHYFDGKQLSRTMPSGPADPTRWAGQVDLFWKLPAYAALIIRLVLHFRAETAFFRRSKGFHLYHEAGYFPFRAAPGVKKVFTVHDLSLLRFPQHHPRERVLYTRLFLKSRCRNVDRFLAVSDFTKKEMGMYLPGSPERTSVTPLAHDPAVFFPRTGAQVRTFIAHNRLPESYFLFVGSGDPRKNLSIIPAALKQAHLRMPLVVAGWSGWGKTTHDEDIIFAGHKNDEDLALLYSGALALVLPSMYEGFGLPILEAMACGCPVVTTQEASLPEVAGPAALFMHDPRDARGLGAVLRDLVENKALRDTLREKGLQRAQQFSWQRTAEQTLKAFTAAFR